MSILIKGMEMPKTCGKCQIKNAIECNRWKLVRSVVLDRHKDCPLVPVPPHGRLIDADKLVRENYGQYGAIDTLALEVIKAAPTIILAEEG